METKTTVALKDYADKLGTHMLTESVRQYKEIMGTCPEIIRGERDKIRCRILAEYSRTDRVAALAVFSVDWVIKQLLANITFVESELILFVNQDDADVTEEKLVPLKRAIELSFHTKLSLADYLLTLDKGFGYTAIVGTHDLYPYLAESMSQSVARRGLCELQFYLKELQQTWIDLDLEEKENIVYGNK